MYWLKLDNIVCYLVYTGFVLYVVHTGFLRRSKYFKKNILNTVAVSQIRKKIYLLWRL